MEIRVVDSQARYEAAIPVVCPYCRQPLHNRAAVSALRKSEVRSQRELELAASEQAAHLAEAEIARREKAWEQKEVSWKDKLKALSDDKDRDAAKLRADIERGATAKAARAVDAKFRSLQQALQNTVAEKEALQRRLEQLTAAERGAFREEDLVRDLKVRFADDSVTRRGRGGDVLQEVFYRTGFERTRAGLIVFEAKDTLHWSNAFVEEVKMAARQHRTLHAVIVTKAFPQKQRGELFVRDDVVVVKPTRVVEVVEVLRRMIVEVHRAGLTAQGQAEKTVALYRYLSSADFRQTFEAVTQIATQLKIALADERKAHQRSWERREVSYNDLAEKTAAVDERIKSIVERPSHVTASASMVGSRDS